MGGQLTSWLATFGPVVRVGVEGNRFVLVGLPRYLHGDIFAHMDIKFRRAPVAGLAS